MLVRQLEEELRLRMRNPNIEMQAQMDALFSENEHLTREVSILRETIRVSQFKLLIMTSYYNNAYVYTNDSNNNYFFQNELFVLI